MKRKFLIYCSFCIVFLSCGKPIYISNVHNKGVYKMDKILKRPTDIKMLFIADFNETQFPYHLISFFPNLEILKIHGKHNSRQKLVIHDTIFPKLILEELNLCFFDFPVFPIQLKHSQIKNIGIAFSNISTIPDSLQYFSNIEYLDFSGNNLTSLPSSIKYMFSLKEITLRNNKFHTIPMELLDVPNLEIIDLCNIEGADELSRKDPNINQNNIDYLHEIDNLKKLLNKETIKRIIIHVKNRDEAFRIRQEINDELLNKKLKIFTEPKASLWY